MSSEINICPIFGGFLFMIFVSYEFLFKKKKLSTNTRNIEHAGFYVLFLYQSF